MQFRSRRGVALLATTATLGAGSLATATQALGAPSRSFDGSGVSSTRSVVDVVVQLVLGLLGSNPTVSQVQAQLSSTPLSSAQLGNLLANASSGQLDALLGGGLGTAQLTGAVSSLESTSELTGLLGTLSPTQTGDLLAPLTGSTLSSALGLLSTAQITSALATLNPTELSSVVDGLTSLQTGALLSGVGAANPTRLPGLLAALDPTQLSGALGLLNATQLISVVSALSPAQITGVLGSPGASASLVTGLAGAATGLGTAPSLGSIDALVGQLQALLGSGLPVVAGMNGLLTTVQPLLGHSGVDTSMLTGLLTTAVGALRVAAPGVDTSALQGLVGALFGVLGLPGAGTTAQPGTSKQPVPAPTPTAGTAGFTAYRAAIGAIKVAPNRRSAKMSVSCPAAAPKGCLVTLSGVIAGKPAFAGKTIVVLRKVTKTITVTLSKATTSRLNKKGGAIKVSAATAFSSLSATTKTVRLTRRH